MIRYKALHRSTTSRFALLATFLISLFSSALPAWSSTPVRDNKAISDSLTKVLQSTTDPNQRIALLYDIFDLAPMEEVNDAGERLLAEALKTNDYESALDMYRRLGSFNISRDTARITTYAEQVRKLPKTPERTATECFLYMCDVSSRARSVSDKDRFDKITELVRRYKLVSKAKTSVNDRLMLLFAICKYMQIPGEPSTDYISELKDLAKKMPYRLDGIENMIYLNAAIIYTDSYQPARAIAADRDLLEIIDRLDRYAQNHGHIYRNYDRFRYTVYRRMLCNAEAMSPDEIEAVYRAIGQLRQKSSLVDNDMNSNPHVEAYYLMAKKQYAEALPLLMKCLEKGAPGSTRNRVMRMTVKAASATGDEKTLAKVAPEYITMLENNSKKSISTRAEDFRAMLNAAVVSGNTKPLDINGFNHITETGELLVVVISVIVAILLVAIALFIALYRRSRKEAAKHQETNDMLTSERDNLKREQASLIESRDQSRIASRNKSDFIFNMSRELLAPLNTIMECSHIVTDNISDDKRKYLAKYVETIDVNADLLRTIFNDVLDINNFESGAINPNREWVSVETLCTGVLKHIGLHSKKNVELRWDNRCVPADRSIYTDPVRVGQALVKLLSNALKFTDKGYVELSCSTDDASHTVTFTVTDTGIGVPTGKEEIIFERFQKLSHMTPGLGLGLDICRIIATLLNGKVHVDTTYKADGARFVLTIPSEP